MAAGCTGLRKAYGSSWWNEERRAAKLPTSSRIEKYLGFPHGISGDELGHRALKQALRFGVEIALALCGDATGAQKLGADTSKRFPNGTIWNAVKLPEIRADRAPARQSARAVELLASASPYKRAYPEAVYLRGLAYLRLHKGPEAAAEFQKILDHKGASTWRFPNWGLYY